MSLSFVSCGCFSEELSSDPSRTEFSLQSSGSIVGNRVSLVTVANYDRGVIIRRPSFRFYVHLQDLHTNPPRQVCAEWVLKCVNNNLHWQSRCSKEFELGAFERKFTTESDLQRSWEISFDINRLPEQPTPTNVSNAPTENVAEPEELEPDTELCLICCEPRELLSHSACQHKFLCSFCMAKAINRNENLCCYYCQVPVGRIGTMALPYENGVTATPVERA